MRKSSFTIAALLMLCCSSLSAQNAVRSEDGNFQSVAKSKTAFTDSVTTYIFTDSKGITHPVYVGSKGAFYIGKTSKNTGKYYRYYLKTQPAQ